VWRGSGIPHGLGPPVGSFLDQLFAKCDVVTGFAERMSVESVTRWIANRNEWIRLDEIQRDLEARYALLERERDALLASTSWRVTAPLRLLSDGLRNIVNARTCKD
jgi:hypothetical protein